MLYESKQASKKEKERKKEKEIAVTNTNYSLYNQNHTQLFPEGENAKSHRVYIHLQVQDH